MALGNRTYVSTKSIDKDMAKVAQCIKTINDGQPGILPFVEDHGIVDVASIKDSLDAIYTEKRSDTFGSLYCYPEENSYWILFYNHQSKVNVGRVVFALPLSMYDIRSIQLSGKLNQANEYELSINFVTGERIKICGPTNHPTKKITKYRR